MDLRKVAKKRFTTWARQWSGLFAEIIIISGVELFDALFAASNHYAGCILLQIELSVYESRAIKRIMKYNVDAIRCIVCFYLYSFPCYIATYQNLYSP